VIADRTNDEVRAARLHGGVPIDARRVRICFAATSRARWRPGCGAQSLLGEFVAVLTTTVVVVSASGCGSSGSRFASGSVSGNSGVGGVTLHATLTFSGAVNQSVSFDSLGWEATSCSTAAASGLELGGAWKLPVNDGTNAVLPAIDLTGSVADYHGPGTYTMQDAFATNESDEYNPSSSSTRSMTVNADGSGHASLTNLRTADASGILSARETWTCS